MTFNRINIEEGVKVPNFPEDENERIWGTKDLNGILDEYKITQDGYLQKLEKEQKQVRNEKEPENIDEARRMSKQKTITINKEWVNVDRHGSFIFYTEYENEKWKYEARFTDGRLDNIILLSPR